MTQEISLSSDGIPVHLKDYNLLRFGLDLIGNYDDDLFPKLVVCPDLTH